MADVISLKDGSVETLFEPKDFQYLVEKYMGYEAETYFENLISKLQEEVDDALNKEQSDLGAYEASLESNTRCFIDIQEVIEEMELILEAPRVDKKKLFKLIEQIQSKINNQI